jgi:hypothetical protein
MRRGKVFAITIVAALALVGCAAHVGPQPEPAKPQISDYCTDGLLMICTTDKKNYLMHDPVNVTVTFKNCSDETIRFQIGKDENLKLYFEALLLSDINPPQFFNYGTWYAVDFMPHTESVILKPGEEYQFNLPALVPPAVTGDAGDRIGGYSILTNEVFKLIIVFRQYSEMGSGKATGYKRWTGICISKPVEITFIEPGEEEPTE